MNIRFLETFVLLAEMRNLRMTAERLHTTQAAISSRIASLEQEFGVRLFERNAREVSLTPDGSKALVHAERMVKLLRDMKEDMLDKHTYAGVIRIGVIESIVHSWFPEFLARLHERYPRLRIEITSDTTAHLTEQLNKGSLDLVLQGNAIHVSQVDAIALGQLPMRWSPAQHWKWATMYSAWPIWPPSPSSALRVTPSPTPPSKECLLRRETCPCTLTVFLPWRP